MLIHSSDSITLKVNLVNQLSLDYAIQYTSLMTTHTHTHTKDFMYKMKNIFTITISYNKYKL